MKSHFRRPRVGIAVVALTAAVTSPAAAHDGLVSSSPTAGSTVTTELERISLTFGDGLLDISDSNGEVRNSSGGSG